MEKTEAIKILRDKGYTADLIDSVVMVTATDTGPSFVELKKIIKEIGYEQSFGLRGGKC